MRDELIGEWRAELKGVDLLYLESVEERFHLGIILRADGTASWEIGEPGTAGTSLESAAPFPITWEASPDRVLSILIPIAPMPEYGIPDWTRDAMQYDILAVSDISLALSDRRFDGEDVIVLRRKSQFA